MAATLAVYYFALRFIRDSSLSRFSLSHRVLGIPFAALLGALPGCGGTIIVVTQFTKGSVSFGAVVAVLITTMGDAAFVLLAQQPIDGLLVLSICAVSGVCFGFIIEQIHGPEFLHPQHKPSGTQSISAFKRFKAQKMVGLISVNVWCVTLVPALVVGVLIAFQVDIQQWTRVPNKIVTGFGAVACFTAIAFWSLSSSGRGYASVACEDDPNRYLSWMRKVALDTQFVTVWVVVAFLAFELLFSWVAIEPVSLANQAGGWSVLIAVAIGLIPGCGPQILVVSLYLKEMVSFSAILGNALSNDGDALFPAIAMAPKAALIASVYSAIPGLLVGYGYFAIFE